MSWAIHKMGQFLGHSGPVDRLLNLREGWWTLAAAIQVLDMPREQRLALMSSPVERQHYPYFAMRRLATTCDEGAKKYAEENWHNGFQVKSLCNHGLRHLVKWTNGDTSEDHLGHTMWSFMAATHVYLFRRQDLCEWLLGRHYTITPELKKMHDEHASRRNALKSKRKKTA